MKKAQQSKASPSWVSIDVMCGFDIRGATRGLRTLHRVFTLPDMPRVGDQIALGFDIDSAHRRWGRVQLVIWRDGDIPVLDLGYIDAPSARGRSWLMAQFKAHGWTAMRRV